MKASRPPIVAPSILSADFARLGEALSIVDPALDWVHCDVMDGRFVPNLTFGPLVVGGVRRLTEAFVDVHLMIEHPERLVAPFVEAGADQLTVHAESAHDSGLRDVLRAIRGHGIKAGLAIKPGTPLGDVETMLGDIDLLLVMTVEPGFGGQEFMAQALVKVHAAKAWREKHGAPFLVQVDGGIGAGTAQQSRAAGADVFVAGHAIYRQPEPRAALAALRSAVA